MTPRSYWVVWDGECGLCSHFAQLARKRDKRKLFQIVSYQHCPTPPMTPEIYEGCKVEMYFLSLDGKVWHGSDAIFEVLALTGWGAVARLFQHAPLVWFARLGYRLVARNRGLLSKWFFGGVACGLENRYPEVDELAP